MKSSQSLWYLPLLGAALLAGCRTANPPPPLPDSTKYSIENTNKFIFLDEASKAFVTCTGLQERVLPDGRLQIVANVKNREDRPMRIQADCVFKDEQGFSTGDETPFQTLTLPANATQTVSFTASNNLARRYSIGVRQP